MNKEYLKYKKYPHFDKKMSVRKAKKILKDENNIKKHGFYPFIHYIIKSKKLDKTHAKIYAKKEPKERNIFYCAHFDRYIYQHYAHYLGLEYNKYLEKKNIDDCSSAYRIRKKKCNIDFSFEMFEYIKKFEKCTIIVGDFTNFFDNLDHKNLKYRLERVIGKKIDNNFYKVYKTLTKYKYINMVDLYDYYTEKNGKRSEKYYIRKLQRLMDCNEFKEFIIGKNSKNGERRLKENGKNFGVVQGSPLSGLFANIYMIDFDEQMNNLANKYSGKYLRYSDDFMIILNESKEEKVKKIYGEIQEFIKLAGQIELKEEKTNIYSYENAQVKCLNNSIFNTSNTTDIVNFLGFSFNGKDINIRNKTITKYFYKMDRKIKKYLKAKKNITLKSIYNKFTTQGIKKKSKNGNTGNFLTYVKRAETIFKGEKQIEKIRTSSSKRVTEKIGIIKSKLDK